MFRRTQAALVPLIVIVSLAAIGCEEPPPSNPQANNTPVVVQTIETVQTPATSANNGGTTAPQGDVAEVGFGRKGHYESNDYISVAISTQFRVQEQLSLALITKAMREYKAFNGNFPKTEDNFFKDIIEANSINLPELPQGQKFQYDVELAKETNAEDCLRILKPKK